MQPWFKSELQLLYRAPVLFASSDPHETMLAGTQALEQHALVWRSGRVDSYLRHLQVGDLSLFLLRYGAGVQVTSETSREFLLFQVPLSGTAHISVGDTCVRADTGTGVIVSPRLPLQLEWKEGCEQLLLKIPLKKIEQVCRQLFQVELKEPIQFNPHFALDTWQGHAWQHLLSTLLSYFRALPSLPSSKWIQAQEEMAVQHLLLSHPHNYSHLLHRPSKATKRSVRLAQEYIEAHLLDPLDIGDIAQAAGTSVSGISAAFKEHHGLSLMSYVREQRLAGAHAELLAAPPTSRVTEIAFGWGFGHLGRFSALYRARYGQLPSQTLRH